MKAMQADYERRKRKSMEQTGGGQREEILEPVLNNFPHMRVPDNKSVMR